MITSRQPSGDNLQNSRGRQNAQNLYSNELLFSLQEIQARLQSQGEIIRRSNSVTGIVEQFTAIIERLNRLVGSITPSSIRQEEMKKRALEEVYLLKNQMKTVAAEFQHNQKDVIKNFQELDREIAKISLVLHLQRVKGMPDTALATIGSAGRETPPEIMQLSAALASDTINMARQLSSLAQEIRTGIISFQLDTVEGSNSLSNIPITPAHGYDLLSNMQHPGALPIDD